MLNRKKIYLKPEGYRSTKLYFLFCEGEIREAIYFHFFNHLASQIIVPIVEIEDGKNSPLGLYDNACKKIFPSIENPNPTYFLNDGDEVWFIIDTDKWGAKIEALREKVLKHHNCFIAQSNPCFEVWLYYHFKSRKPEKVITNWKAFLNEEIKGGYQPHRHPMLIETAIINSETNFSISNNQPDLTTTELFRLGKRILPLIKEKLDSFILQNNNRLA